MVTRIYVNCLLSFQDATSNEIKDFRGGVLQVEIGGRSRLRIENA
jgi:hypothetical protein